MRYANFRIRAFTNTLQQVTLHTVSSNKHGNSEAIFNLSTSGALAILYKNYMKRLHLQARRGKKGKFDIVTEFPCLIELTVWIFYLFSLSNNVIVLFNVVFSLIILMCYLCQRVTPEIQKY